MHDDERAIRELILSWMLATQVGDIAHLKLLMAEDVVFLQPGQPPIRGRDNFAAAFAKTLEKFQIHATSSIQEIEIFGSAAYCWNELKVTMTPIVGGAPMTRTGPTLTIFKKLSNGRWAISRDANMLVAG